MNLSPVPVYPLHLLASLHPVPASGAPAQPGAISLVSPAVVHLDAGRREGWEGMPSISLRGVCVCESDGMVELLGSVGTADGMFPKPSGFISHILLERSP